VVFIATYTASAKSLATEEQHSRSLCVSSTQKRILCTSQDWLLRCIWVADAWKDISNPYRNEAASVCVPDLMTRKHQRIRNNHILSSTSRENNHFCHIFRRQRIATTSGSQWEQLINLNSRNEESYSRVHLICLLLIKMIPNIIELLQNTSANTISHLA
jgi:hypothetical protein